MERERKLFLAAAAIRQQSIAINNQKLEKEIIALQEGYIWNYSTVKSAYNKHLCAGPICLFPLSKFSVKVN